MSSAPRAPLARRTSGLSKKPSPALAKRKASPHQISLRDVHRRAPSEALLEQVSNSQSTVTRTAMERDMQNMLELDFQDDIRVYMAEMEARTAASVELIDQQPELQWYMRPYLVEFLIEIHQQHRLRAETLYLALNIVDRYVSKRIVFKKHYQLVGCAALWIAAKFEDAKDRVPTVPELRQMCCGAYDESAFVQMEGHVLSTINWVVGHPTTESWLRLACVSGPIEEVRTQHIARFLMEITLFHKEYLVFRPSELASASLLLARYMLGKSRRVDYESENVLKIIQTLDQRLAEKLDTISVIVVKKYSFPFYSRASSFVQEWYLSGRRFAYSEWVGVSTASPVSKSMSSMDFSSSPASSKSSTSNSIMSPSFDSDYSIEGDGPLTPATPASMHVPTLSYYVAAGKENAHVTKPTIKNVPSRRQPLGKANENTMETSARVSRF